MNLLDLFSKNPVAFFIIIASLLLSLTIHEFAHAWTADILGDSTPRRAKRVTLNPLKHLDPFGTLLIIFVGFGFARPVPVDFDRLGRWGSVLVAAAGPISNFIIAFICILLIKFLPSSQILLTALSVIMSINLTLAIFNLLPIPLFDGSRILGGLIPPLGRSLREFEMMPFASLVVMGFVILLGDRIGTVIMVVRHFLMKMLGL